MTTDSSKAAALGGVGVILGSGLGLGLGLGLEVRGAECPRRGDGADPERLGTRKSGPSLGLGLGLGLGLRLGLRLG